MKPLVRLLSTGLILLLVITAAEASPITVRFHDAVVTGPGMELGDVASISGLSAERAEEISSIGIGRSPAPGGERTVNIEYIRMKLIQEGFLPIEITFEGTPNPVVTRAHQELDPGRVEEAVRNAVEPLLEEGSTLEITRMPSMRPLPTGRLDLSVDLPERMRGTFYCNVTAAVGEESVRFPVGLRITRYGLVVVSSRRIERNEIIGVEDISVAAREMTAMPPDVVTDASTLIGLRARRVIPEGAEFTSGMVEVPPLVRSGEAVEIVARYNGVEVSVAGQAVTNGGMGETVRVRNSVSRRTVSGRVIAPGRVLVLE